MVMWRAQSLVKPSVLHCSDPTPLWTKNSPSGSYFLLISARRGGPLYPQSLHHLNTVLTKRSILLNRRSSNLKILLEKGWLAALQAKRIFGARVLLLRKGIPSSREGAPHKTVWQPMMKS